MKSLVPWPADSPPSRVDNPILEFKPLIQELSFHEIYQTYKPSQKVIKECKSYLENRRQFLLRWEEGAKYSLLKSVRYADIDFALQLVRAATIGRELAELGERIALCDFILRRSSADEVKNIPLTDFIRFNRQGWARCPFHPDKTPSLKYYPKENRVHCFSGCGQKNVIQVYAVLNSVNNKDAYFALQERL